MGVGWVDREGIWILEYSSRQAQRLKILTGLLHLIVVIGELALTETPSLLGAVLLWSWCFGNLFLNFSQINWSLFLLRTSSSRVQKDVKPSSQHQELLLTHRLKHSLNHNRLPCLQIRMLVRESLGVQKKKWSCRCQILDWKWWASDVFCCCFLIPSFFLVWCVNLKFYYLFLFFLLTIIRTWIGRTQLKETEKTPRFLYSGLLNSLGFTEKVIQRPLEQGSSFPSCLMVKISS